MQHYIVYLLIYLPQYLRFLQNEILFFQVSVLISTIILLKYKRTIFLIVGTCSAFCIEWIVYSEISERILY